MAPDTRHHVLAELCAAQAELPAWTELPCDTAVRAYELYVRRGRIDGFDVEDWRQAEAELLGDGRIVSATVQNPNIPDAPPNPNPPAAPPPSASPTPPAPPAPTDEPPPKPIDDPPAEIDPKPPYTVR